MGGDLLIIVYSFMKSLLPKSDFLVGSYHYLIMQLVDMPIRHLCVTQASLSLIPCEKSNKVISPAETMYLRYNGIYPLE